MTRSRIYWFAGAAALLFLALFYLFDSGNPTAPTSGVTLRMGATSAPPPGQEATPSNERSEAQHLINSGQFAPPPGNPDKMYSIASPFAAATPAAQPASAAGGSPSNIQPGLTMLGASPGSNTPAQLALKKSPAAAVPAPPQPHSQPIEFETPPGIGSAKGGQ